MIPIHVQDLPALKELFDAMLLPHEWIWLGDLDGQERNGLVFQTRSWSKQKAQPIHVVTLRDIEVADSGRIDGKLFCSCQDKVCRLKSSDLEGEHCKHQTEFVRLIFPALGYHLLCIERTSEAA